MVENAEGAGTVDLQKANIWKRIAAWLLDLMLLSVLAVGCGAILSVALHYDTHNAAMQAGYARYEEQYDVTFGITAEQYEAKTEGEKEVFEQATEALLSDEQVIYEYNMVVNLSLIITTIGILLGVVIMEFAVPLFLKNGQTVGKKVFGLGVIRTDSVRISPIQLFIRAVLGKYTIETMIPVYIFLMLLWGTLDMTGLIVFVVLVIVQLVCLGITRENAAIHDKLSGTVVVDISSQKIFASFDEKTEYIKRIHAERAQHEDY